MPRVSVKICGITRPEDAAEAAAAEADAIGIIFAPLSPRCVQPAKAASIVEAAGSAWRVGVFVDEHPERICELVESLELDAIQLHGDEPLDVCRKLQQQLPPHVRLVKAVRFQNHIDVEKLKGYAELGLCLLVDGAFGGGPLAWSSLRGLNRVLEVPLSLGGALTPENVQEAILQALPSGVDVSRGVEVPGQPGVKQPDLIRRFVAEVRQAEDRVAPQLALPPFYPRRNARGSRGP